jgi:branched-chain amino acid transport system permease protein
VLYLPNGLASLRVETFQGWWTASRSGWQTLRDRLSGETARRKAREKELRERRHVG